MKYLLLIFAFLFLSLPATATSLVPVYGQINANNPGAFVTLIEIGDTWTPGNPGSPTFTISGGCTIISQQIFAANGIFSPTLPDRVQLLLSAPASGSCTVTDPSTGSTGTITIRTPLTHYVRSDGGTPTQCTGLADAAYPGSGSAIACAYNDTRYLMTTGAFTNQSPGSVSASTGWTYDMSGTTGGDAIKIRDCIQYSTVSPFPATPGSSGACTFGQQGPGTSDWGISLAGDANNSGLLPPPNGWPAQHTTVMGYNAGSCSAKDANKRLTQAALIYGTYAVGEVVKLEGSSYVDVGCLRLSDQSSCGRSAQSFTCSTTPGSLSNFAGSGIGWSNASTNDTLTDVQVDGMASLGMGGPTGTGVVMTDLLILGNAGAGWNADHGDGTTGTGTLLVQNYQIIGNGCAEEYPIVHALPYQDCTDDNIGGYGDGFGTSTVPSSPGWVAHFDNGIVAYNTQDGLDGLHMGGSGTTLTITRTLAYGNAGNQDKIGNNGALINNIINGNCLAMGGAIAGFPAIFTYSPTSYTITQPGGAGTISTVQWTTTTQSPLLVVGQHIHLSGYATSIFFNNVVFTITAVTSTSVTAQNNAFTHSPVGPVTETGTLTQGWNSGLSDLCRAGNSPWVIGVLDGPNALVMGNTVYGSRDVFGGDLGTIALEGTCTTCGITFINNIQVGFDTGFGLPQRFSDGSGIGGGIFSQAASVVSNNNCVGATTSGTSCTIAQETNSIFVMPQLVSTTFNPTTFNNVNPSSGTSNILAVGIANANMTVDFSGAIRSNPPAMGSLQFMAAPSVQYSVSGTVHYSGQTH